MKKVATYNQAIRWIAREDETYIRDDPEEICDLISIMMVADLFERSNVLVAEDVIKLRKKEDQKKKS